MGGGIGLLSRTYGLTCDSVKNIRFLTADAEVIDVNEESYPDLFWALLGGGNGSYGIALGFTFKMHLIPVVSYYTLSWEWDPAIVPEIFETWQKWSQTLPNDISTSLNLVYEGGKIIFMIEGLKVSDEPFTEWVKAFGHFNPVVEIFKGSYLESSKLWVGEPALPFLKSKSKMYFKPLSIKEISKIIHFFEELKDKQPDFLVILSFGALGGVIPNFHTSYYPRNALGWIYFSIYWNLQSQDPEALALSRSFYDEISPLVSDYSYANTVDYDLGPHYLKAYYGNHVDRLIRVKNKYDPRNVFHWKRKHSFNSTLYIFNKG